MSKLVHDFFGDAYETLAEAYKGAGVSDGKRPQSRTSSNREALVASFLERTLPVSTKTVQGAVMVDRLGHASGDIDVAILAPWSAPIGCMEFNSQGTGAEDTPFNQQVTRITTIMFDFFDGPVTTAPPGTASRAAHAWVVASTRVRAIS